MTADEPRTAPSAATTGIGADAIGNGQAMRSEVKEISPVQVELQVEVPWDRVKKDLDSSFREVGKGARIKGFRPGKVPPKVIRQLFGGKVKQEVAASLVQEGLIKAVEEHELQIVARPEVEEPAMTDGEPLTFTARVEVRPKLETVVTEGLEVWKRPIEVPNEAVDEVVEQKRRENAEVRTPEPMRPAKAGDTLKIDYSVSIDGEVQDDMGAEDRPAALGDDQLLPELEEGLTGMSPGEEKVIPVDFPEDHGNEKLRGKRAEFKVSVKELQERLLPEVDDEFAKDVSDFETLLELRLDIRKQLEADKEREREAELKDQLIDRLVEANPVEVPPSMVQEQKQHMLQDMLQLAQMTGGLPPSFEQLFAGVDERAERRVRAGLVLGALARTEKIEVTPEDVDAKLAEIAEQTGKHVAKVKADYQGERREQLESQLLEAKLMDTLMARATIRDGEPPKKDEDAADAAAASDDAGGAAGAPGDDAGEKAADTEE